LRIRSTAALAVTTYMVGHRGVDLLARQEASDLLLVDVTQFAGE
jgi:hypothetical protein